MSVAYGNVGGALEVAENVMVQDGVYLDSGDSSLNMRAGDGSPQGVEMDLLLGDEKKEGDEMDQVAPHTGGLFSGYANIVTATIGVGVLSYPFAFYRAGILTGTFLTLAFSVLQFYSGMVLVRFARRYADRMRQHHTLEQLMEAVLGPFMYVLSVIAIFMTTIGVLVGFVVVIMDGAHPAVRMWVPDVLDGVLRDRWFTLVLISIFILFPLTMLPNMHDLWISSVFAILSILYVGFIVSYRSTADAISEGVTLDFAYLGTSAPTTDECHSCRYLVQLTPVVILAVPLEIFALGAQLQILPVYLGTRERSRDKFWLVLIASIATCAVVYVVVGTFAYIGEGQGTQGNILTNFELKNNASPLNILTGLAQLGIIMHVALAYPVQLMPGRMALDKVIDILFVRLFWKRPLSKLVWYLIHTVQNVIIIIFTGAIALLIPHVAVIFGFVGATTLPIFVFLFPALLLIIRGISLRERIEGVFFLIMAILIIPLSVGVEIYTDISEHLFRKLV